VIASIPFGREDVVIWACPFVTLAIPNGTPFCWNCTSPPMAGPPESMGVTADVKVIGDPDPIFEFEDERLRDVGIGETVILAVLLDAP
jgi:hypothetical protein